MTRYARNFGFALVAVTLLSLATPLAFASPDGGTSTGTGTVAAGTSMYFNVWFDDGAPAVVTVSGNGAAPLEVIIRDATGNIMKGTGTSDRKTATLNVYRAGNFRIEVRNTGSYSNSFSIKTTN